MPDPSSIAVWAVSEEETDAQKLALRLKIPFVIQEDPPSDYTWLLFFDEDSLLLHNFAHPEFKPVTINYLSNEFMKRWKHASRNDLLCKAVGLKKGCTKILDATCGLGYDAFFLATMEDLEVFTCERNIIVSELVMNALLRVKEQGRFEEFPLYFYMGDSMEYLQNTTEQFDTIYLDPMYPREEEKSAKQKKEMQIFRELLGDDGDAEKLFDLAYEKALKRVVVKRPDDAAEITSKRKPDIVFPGKTIRFDVYLKV